MSTPDSPTAPANKLSPRFVQALEFAIAKHNNQSRKGKDVTYLSHLLGVSSFILESGGTEDAAIAGLLHDVIEDCGGADVYDEIESRFGQRIADIAMACSDSFVEDRAFKRSWQERKDEHIAKIREHHIDDDEVMFVTAADKLHNLTCIVADLAAGGAGALDRFTEPDKVGWYYEQMVGLLKESHVPAFLLVQLEARLAEFRSLTAS